jgi:hypothetical protein
MSGHKFVVCFNYVLHRVHSHPKSSPRRIDRLRRLTGCWSDGLTRQDGWLTWHAGRLAWHCGRLSWHDRRVRNDRLIGHDWWIWNDRWIRHYRLIWNHRLIGHDGAGLGGLCRQDRPRRSRIGDNWSGIRRRGLCWCDLGRDRLCRIHRWPTGFECLGRSIKSDDHNHNRHRLVLTRSGGHLGGAGRMVF